MQTTAVRPLTTDRARPEIRATFGSLVRSTKVMGEEDIRRTQPGSACSAPTGPPYTARWPLSPPSVTTRRGAPRTAPLQRDVGDQVAPLLIGVRTVLPHSVQLPS